MKKLAMISSYGDLCGNASYTKALEDGLSEIFNVTVLPLSVGLLENNSKSAQIAADRVINQYCETLKQFDHVNIQFEKALYGLTNDRIFKTFQRLATACKSTIITLHRYDQKRSVFSKATLRLFFGFEFKNLAKEILINFRNNYDATLYDKMLRFCEENRIGVVVHTPRDASYLKAKFPKLLYLEQPLSFLGPKKLKYYQEKADKQQFRHSLGYQEEDQVIGIFGFISPYKGYEIAIKALKFLPKQYKLAIFGGEHPMTIKAGYSMNGYIKSLLELIERNDLQNRVQFCGNLDDDAFIKSLLCSDFNILPYYEVNQSGSGIAALSLESGSKTVMSQNLSFIELAKYAKGAFRTFAIGNYIELANIIQNFKEPLTKELNEYFEKHNVDTSAKAYADLYQKLL